MTGITSPDGRVRVAIDPVGGGLRELMVDEVALVESYPEGERPPYASGAVLFPWPNRTRDGRWRAHGIEHQLLVDEPELENASHGLLRDQRFDVTQAEEASVALRTEVCDRPGYPFYLELALTYRALADGVQVESTVVNLGGEQAPFALGFHPYLRLGDVPVRKLTLSVPAAEVLDLDERLIPVGRRTVAGTGADPRAMPLATATLNHCYGGLTTVDGTIRHALSGEDGRLVELTADRAFGWLQVYTCPHFPRPEGTGTAIALEPMTAPPNALQTGQDLIWLDPGRKWAGSWALRLH